METYTDNHRLEHTPADCHVESLGEILPRLLERYGIDVPRVSDAAEAPERANAELEMVA